jgi:hypothetical protein
MKLPKTIEDAVKMVYNKGKSTYKPDRCVYPSKYYPTDIGSLHQCGRHNGYGPGGLYCWQHAKKAENGSE